MFEKIFSFSHYFHFILPLTDQTVLLLQMTLNEISQVCGCWGWNYWPGKVALVTVRLPERWPAVSDTNLFIVLWVGAVAFTVDQRVKPPHLRVTAVTGGDAPQELLQFGSQSFRLIPAIVRHVFNHRSDQNLQNLKHRKHVSTRYGLKSASCGLILMLCHMWSSH